MRETERTKPLREDITARLLSLCPNVAYGQADKGTARPYLVYNLDTLSKSDGLNRIELQVDCVDYGTDTEDCERLADMVEDTFDHLYVFTTNFQYSAYFNRRQPVTEEDKNIIRRRVTAELHYYDI